MKTYRFSICTVKVIDCASAAIDFRVCEVYNHAGKMVHEIRTSKKGKGAAKLAMYDAIHFRMI